MAAGAGSLGLLLGGAAVYHGRLEPRPVLGEGRPAGGQDIARALTLVSPQPSAVAGGAAVLGTAACLNTAGACALPRGDMRLPAQAIRRPGWDLSTGINPLRVSRSGHRSGVLAAPSRRR
jgi:hypothetical protein